MTTVTKIDRQKLAHEISLKIEEDKDGEVRSATRKLAMEVAEWWKNEWRISTGNHGPGVHPYDTGAYAESISVKQLRGERGRFVSGFQVVSSSPWANFIEFGTGNDKPGSRSPWGPFTPTPAFFPASKTAFYFKGTSP